MASGGQGVSVLLHALRVKDFILARQILCGKNTVANEDTSHSEPEKAISLSPYETPVSLCCRLALRDVEYLQMLKEILSTASGMIGIQDIAVSPTSDDFICTTEAQLTKFGVLSNKYYMLLTAVTKLGSNESSFDPCLDAFQLTYKLRTTVVAQNPNLAASYEVMAANAEVFAADLLSCVQTEDELNVICRGSSQNSDDCLYLIRRAVELQQKQFVSHYIIQKKMNKVWCGEILYEKPEPLEEEHADNVENRRPSSLMA